MKILKIPLLVICIISCTDIKTENKLSGFDKALGKENGATLDFLVSDFENTFLKRQYPNLNTKDAYRQFLIELRDEKMHRPLGISKEARLKFASSDLRLEMYQFPDSVWVLENSTLDKVESDSPEILETPFPYIKSRYKFTNEDGTTEYTCSTNYIDIQRDRDYDSIIKSEMETPRYNLTGTYLQALRVIKHKSEFHEKLYETKKSFGFLPPESTASVMLDYGIDLNDELNRKIIVLELLY